MYHDPLYEWALGACEYFMDVDVIDVRRLYTSSRDWQIRWPRDELPRVDTLAFITAPDDTIGRGVGREINDCQKRGIACFLLRRQHDGAPVFHRFWRMRLKDAGDDWLRWATVVPAAPGDVTCPQPDRQPDDGWAA
jgi:hypothetical protein